MVPLGEVASIERQSISPDAIVTGTRYVGLEHIESGGASLSFGEVANGELASNKFRFSPNHILFGKLRPYLAKIAAPDFEGICSTDILPILPTDRIDKRFLLHFLRLNRNVDWAASRATGVNLPRLSPNELLCLEIPLPPLPEQRRIAAILDKADALRRKRKRAIELLDSLTQSIFLEMFGKKPEQLSRWSKPIPLSEVADIGSGITKGRKLNGSATREVPYLAVVNVQDRRLDLSTVKYIEATEGEIERYRLQPNDLLLTEGGDPDKLGRGTLWAGELAEAIHQNHIFRVRTTSNRLLPLFLNWLVGSGYGKKYFLRVAKQTTGIASINKTQLSAFPTVIPPMDLQQKFVIAAEGAAGRMKQLLVAETHANALFSSLQSRAFSGQL
ncbi:restriction endonuclease subunit S [Mesorhizobium sp. 8]|uniref:restriction endonuclease subunit S n=1 Tax=Mesorhizobium sp. 8 TaxID=2584466 RepID=UPI0011204D88|nr:restriction endonuclease subunit S [Mesorhizobium sp. 8]QDC02315.1 restriction endonuclease subunit S [Mesorhizobium sp. 8]